jgi:hypothetical protein
LAKSHPTPPISDARIPDIKLDMTGVDSAVGISLGDDQPFPDDTETVRAPLLSIINTSVFEVTPKSGDAATGDPEKNSPVVPI